MNEMENEHKLFNEKLKHLEKVVSQIEKQNGVNN
jgi:exonuclease VII small subunit